MTGERHGMQIIFHPLVTLFRASQIREKETSDTCSWLLFYVSSISLDLLYFDDLFHNVLVYVSFIFKTRKIQSYGFKQDTIFIPYIFPL